ncbi:hypothetical protein LP419_23440 [Massilia sp. H-1]|nr:hypothetical protein LP419_23440 [Massilia sp. H-1]
MPDTRCLGHEAAGRQTGRPARGAQALMSMPAPTRNTRLLALALAAVLARLRHLSPDGGQDQVRQLAAARGQAVPDIAPASRQAHIDALLAAPLTADGAVDIALLNNRTLQAWLRRTGHRRSRPGASVAPAKSRVHLRPPARPRRRRDRTPADAARDRPADDAAHAAARTAPLRTGADAHRGRRAAHRRRDPARLVRGGRRPAKRRLHGPGEQRRRSGRRSGAPHGAGLSNWSRLQQAREQAFYADAVAQLGARATRAPSNAKSSPA